MLVRSLHLYPCSRPLQALVRRPCSKQQQVVRSLRNTQLQAPHQLLAWLQDLAVAEPPTAATSLYTSIMAQADHQALLQLTLASKYGTSTSSSSTLSSRSTSSSSIPGLSQQTPQQGTCNEAAVSQPDDSVAVAAAKAAAAAAADTLLNAALCQQHIHMPAGFAVPSHTTVPAYQFVGIFRSHLGYPNLPQAAKTSSLEAKWGLLHLSLTYAAEGESATFLDQQRQLMDQVLLPHAAGKLARVLANPKIPEDNKRSAELRFQHIYTQCSSNITRWAAAACGSPAFQQLQPVMQAVAGRLQAAIAAGHHQPTLPGNQTNSSGKLMEKTVRQVLQDALPPGWSLLHSLHLLGADGATFIVQPGCKYEVDLLILDDQGVAVAVVEVKLGAANPLMSLCNDAGSLLRLVDITSGRLVTAITQAEVAPGTTGGGSADDSLLAAELGAAAAAGADSSSNAVSSNSSSDDDDERSSSSSKSQSSNGKIVGQGSSQGLAAVSSVMAKARAATVAAPFSEGSGWRAVHFRMHEHVLPIYVIGKAIGEAEVVKGLSSLVDSSTLKLLSRSAGDVRQALLPSGGCQEAHSPAHESSAAADLCSRSCDSADDAQSVQCSSSSSIGSSNGSGNIINNASSITSGGADPFQGNGLAGGSSRVLVQLNQEQQQLITDQLKARVQMLQERCLIYSLHGSRSTLLQSS